MRRFFRCLSCFRSCAGCGVFAFLVVVIQLMFPQTIRAQRTVPAPEWSLSGALGLQQSTFMDDQVGQLNFSGKALSPHLSLIKKSAGSETILETSAVWLKARTRVETNHDATERLFYLDLDQVFLLGDPQKKLRFGLGGAIDAIYVRRWFPDLINSRNFTDFGISADGLLAARFDSDPAGSGWTLSETFKGSLIGAYYYSPYDRQYQTGSDGSTKKERLIPSLRLGAPDHWLRLISVFSVAKKINQRSAGGVKYRWDFYRVTQSTTSRHDAREILLFYEFSF